jgi:hypothetical protein
VGRLRLDICRCVSPIPEAIVSGGGERLGEVCRKCMHVMSPWRRRRHVARLEQLPEGPLVAVCGQTRADTADAVFTLLPMCAPPGEPEDRALWVLDQICTTGKHEHARRF